MVIALCVASAAMVVSLSGAPAKDTDGDGLADAVEDRDRDRRRDADETDPRRRDTDRDGVADGVEDRNRNGRVDRGESDPRVPGLFPGSPPHIPEPLAFDMVRGLGARAGELEVNTLVRVPWSRNPAVEWAPEIEWAPRDGLAFELELPMHGGRLHGLKLAAQVTLPRPRDSAVIAGWQVIAELVPGERALKTTALFLAAYRFSRRWSALGMTGLRLDWQRRPLHFLPTLLVNPSVFVDLGERVTLGLEHNLELGSEGALRVLALPQLHVQISKRWRVQVGAGVLAQHRRATGVAGMRLIFEL